MSDPFESYMLYNALKLHFESSYDAVKYNFKSNVTPSSFFKRKDKYFFAKLAKKYNGELKDFYISQFINTEKYVGDMIYGTDDDNAIDKAVRLVIMLIMVVFDPLAVLLLIAANISMQQRIKVPKPVEPEPVKEPKPVSVTETVEVNIENIADIEEGYSRKKRGFPNRKGKLEPKYDYDAEYAFREKEIK